MTYRASVCVLILVASGCHCHAVAADTVSIELVGDIAPRCRFLALPGSLDFGEVGKSGLLQISFRIDCNAPFAYEVRSRQGGLKNKNNGKAPLFTNAIPYTLELRIPTDNGLIFDQCDSVTLAAATPSCGHGDSGSAIAIEQTASLVISWSTNEELIEGAHADIVTVNISPRL